jgi:hypothetical protein
MQQRRLIEFSYLIWSTFMSFYWLILFPEPGFMSLSAFGISLALLLLYGWAFLKNRVAVKQIALLASFLVILLFSVPAYGSAPACDCYRTSFADLAPNGIALAMTAIVWFSYSRPKRQ